MKFQDAMLQAINKMSNEERRALREKLEAEGCTELPRNLYFNYQTQEWI